MALLVAAGLCGDVLGGGLSLELGSLETPVLSVEGLVAEIGAEATPARVTVREIRLGERRWRDLALNCGELRISDGVLRCDGGALDLPPPLERMRVDLRLDPQQGSVAAQLRTVHGERVEVAMRPDGTLRASASSVLISNWLRLLPMAGALDAVSPDAELAFEVEFDRPLGGPRLRLNGSLREGAFSSADGLQAAEGIEIDFSGEVAASGEQWHWRASAEWVGGETYLHPVYMQSGAGISGHGRFDSRGLEIQRLALALDGVRTLEARARLAFDPVRIEEGAVVVANADLAVIGPRYLVPLFDPAGTDDIGLDGSVSLGVRVVDGEVVAVDAALDQVRLSRGAGRVEFGPVSGLVPWREHGDEQAWLSVGGGRWEKLSLGAFEVNARVRGRAIDADRFVIPVLDGQLVVEDLALRRRRGEWSGRGSLHVEPISMALLTEALGLPPMAGVLSASIPDLRVTPGAIRLDGALVISVFGGYLQLTGLQWLEPFSPASYLYADLQARNLDLMKITNTFSFGSVSGRIDADVLGLQLVDWRPVRFDASIRSSPGRYERRISQRAVQNIGALGGGGAVAAIQRGALRFFDSFGYREVGLSCRLERGVCQMGGIGDRPGDGFVIIRGGGVPALNVIGYNRRVDWQELLDRVGRVIETNTAPVIE